MDTSAFRTRLNRILASTGLEPGPPSWLDKALTHSSFVHETGESSEDNERLEYLGDAVLGLCVAEMLFDQLPELDPGEMTRLRAELVSGDTLAAVALAWQLGEDLYLGKGEELNGGRSRPSNLSRAMEAVIGAVYLSAGYRGASGFARAAFGDRLLAIVPGSASRDPKSALQERAQAHGEVPTYQVVTKEGPDHAPQWTVSVQVDAVSCQATAGSRRQAEKDAARQLLAKLQSLQREDLL